MKTALDYAGVSSKADSGSVDLALTEDWEFAVLEVYNFRKQGKFDRLIEFIKANHASLDGDFFEAGVYRGTSLIAIALLLKELGSTKRVYGFDSFSGFPPMAAREEDRSSQFDILAEQGRITISHLEAVRRSARWQQSLADAGTVKSSRKSGLRDFSRTSRELVEAKIKILGLDNIVLVEGPFDQTMVKERLEPAAVFAGIIDCDLYGSYRSAYEFIWPRLAPDGMLHLDEYYSIKFPGPRRATDDFVRNNRARLEMSRQADGEFERWYLIKEANTL